MTIRKLSKAGLLATLLTAGCSSSSDGSGTTGRIIALKTQASIKDNESQPKVNALGWTVTLSEAYLSVGPLYYYSGDPVLSRRHVPKAMLQNMLASVSDWLVRPAYAHPGHYIEGAAMGQMLVPTTLDLLASATVNLADGEGITGDTNSAKFTWQSPPQGDLAPGLQGHVVISKGTATKDGTAIQFIAKADEPDVHDGNDKAEVAGCAFGSSPGLAGVTMDGDGTVTLTLSPSVWFDQVDFSYVAAGAPGAPTPDAVGVVDIADTLAWEGFIRGVKKGTAYEFSYGK
jgi:hypothetical protein